jgi:FkbM family methyltransferase
METAYFYNKDKNFSFNVTPFTKVLTPCSFSDTLWEDESITCFFKKVPIDKAVTIVDIGSQTGLYTLYAKFLPLSTFYSFEPFESSFNELNKNIKLNGITNVNTFNLAIAHKESEMVLNTCKSHNGLHTLGETPLRFSDSLPIKVKTIDLDTFFSDKSIDFIKIDTEGYEYFILLGGMNVIKKYKPIIQLEWQPINMKQCGVSEYMLNNLIEELGYEKTYIQREELIIEHKNKLI